MDCVSNHHSLIDVRSCYIYKCIYTSRRSIAHSCCGSNSIGSRNKKQTLNKKQLLTPAQHIGNGTCWLVNRKNGNGNTKT